MLLLIRYSRPDRQQITNNQQQKNPYPITNKKGGQNFAHPACISYLYN
jgi:hypothetical protein